jgi:exopolysaccharide transport family protein
MDAPRFSPIQNDFQSEPFQGQSEAFVWLLDQVVGLGRRQLFLILAIIAFTMALGVLYLMSTPPVYTAHARLIIDSGKLHALQQQTTPTVFIPTSLTEIMTQVEIVKSDSIASNVVKNQHLTENPAFVGGGGTGTGPLEALFARVRGLFGFTTVRPADTRSESELTRTALRTVLAQRAVNRINETYVLDIGYTALDPKLAATMANAVANAYIDDQLDAKYQTTQRASAWLQERIKELRAQAEAAELAVFDYKQKNKIIDVGGVSTDPNSPLLGDEQVTQLNQQLSNARGTEAEAKARLERINEIMNEDVPDAGTADSLQSAVIGRLRDQYLDLAARERIFSARYGRDHLAVVNLRTQMVELRRSISDELNRIAQAYKSDYAIAKLRVKTMEKNLADQISSAQVINRDRIGLRDLESTAKVYHSIYDNFLSRYMEATQQQSFPITEARVISTAQAPSYQSAPNPHKVLATAGFVGVLLGFAAGFMRESINRVFRTGHQVEVILRTNCLAVLPRLTTSVAVGGGTGDDARAFHEQTMSGERLVADRRGFFSRVIDEPRSLFTEGFRSIKVAADIASAIKENKVIGVTSSVPKEGKSTIASNLAELMAHAGKRVILIEGDLRNLTLSRELGRGAKTGLLEVLADQFDLQHTVYTDSRSGLRFLPAVINSRLAHTDEILASKAFKRLLDGLRQDHDYIIVDLPPLAPVSDARATAGIIDSYIYVIEWGRTSINTVRHHLTAAPELHDRLLGVVLSKADLKLLARYERYYGGNNYYNYKYYNAKYGYGS